ncbi:MAG: phage tail tape measure protein [Vagococcus sp.]|uniref:phage tail tape measure protein n=1 Tax=Vagococcus sp. TaxID=1933889 RepID=UPI002FC90C93
MVKKGRPLGDMIIGISMDGTQVGRTLDDLQRRTRQATSEMKAQLGVLDKVGDGYGKTEAKVEGLNKVLTTQDEELKGLHKKHKEMVEVYGENSKEATRYATRINNLVKRQAAYSKEIEDAEIKLKEYKRGTVDTKKEIELMDRSVNASVSALKNQGKETTANVVLLNNLKKQHELQTRVVNDEKLKLEDLTTAKGKDSLETKEQIVVLQEAIAKQSSMGKSVEDLEEKYGKLNEATANFKDRIDLNSEKLDKFSQKATEVGKNLTTRVTLPIAGGFIAASKAVIDFEDSFAGVTKTVDGTPEQLQDISDGIREMALVIPQSTTELNQIAESAGQLGIAVPSILDFTDVMAKMSVATNLGGEEGAQALAKFANVTRMSQGDFDRLGSSIVELGNNMATTEADIMNMASRLAGAGAQIGLSEADIMGLAASLSSVGIEAEMGGSAISKIMVNQQVATKMGYDNMKKLEAQTGMTRRELELLANHDGLAFKDLAINLNMTTTEMKNVMKAGKNLEGFANIAGVSAQQFKQAFEEDAIGALQMFINGLGTAEEKGTSAIELLDEMGIREVRLRDSLLKAAGANELFADSIEMSNNAWDENIALNKEAETKFNTTASQIQLLKNDVIELGIGFGEILLPEIRKGVEWTSNLIKSYQGLDDRTKRLIVTVAKFTAIIGPSIWAVGKLGAGLKVLNNIGGSSITMLKLFSKRGVTTGTSLLKMGGDVAKTTTTMSAFSGATTIASGSLLATAGPLLGVAAGIGVLGGALYLGVKKYDEFTRKQEDTARKTDKFGTDVSDATEKAAQSFTDMREQANTELALLDTATIEQGEKLSKSIMENYKGMAQEVVGAIKETQEEGIKAIQALNNIDGMGAEWQQGFIERYTGSYDKELKEIEAAQNRMNELWLESGGNLQNLSEKQREEFNKNAQFIDNQTSVFAQSYKDLKRMAEVWSSDQDTITQEQYSKEMKKAKSYRDEALKNAEETFEKKKEIFEKEYQSNRISQEDYNAAIAKLNGEFNESQAKANQEYVNISNGLSKHLKETELMNLQTMQTANSAKVDSGDGYIVWFDAYAKKNYATEEEWVEATKKHNKELSAEGINMSEASKKNLDDYEKSQQEFYESLGKGQKQAAIFAKADRELLELEFTQLGNQILKTSQSTRDNYVKGLQGKNEDEIAAIARKWGIDLTDETTKIDLGPYGSKTALEFFNEFQSGSEEGAKQARIFFSLKLAEVTTNDLNKVGKENVETFKQGLQSGALTIDELADVFTVNLMMLFPDDFDKLGKDQVEMLKQGLKSGKIDTADLKQKYHVEFNNIFKKDMTKLGKEEVDKLKKGIELGIVNPDDLPKKYKDKLNSIFFQDITELSEASMKTLKLGLELGVADVEEYLKKYPSLIKEGTKVDLGESGTFTMQSLQKAYDEGKITTEEFLGGFRTLVDNGSKKNLYQNGYDSLNSYNNGQLFMRPLVYRTTQDTVNEVLKKMSIGPQALIRGNNTSEQYGKGIEGKRKVPLDAAYDISKDVLGYYNNVVGSSNDLSKELGSNEKIPFIGPMPKKHKFGTKGALKHGTLSYVGDGGEHELIQRADGRMEMSPNRSVLTYLNKGDIVYNGRQTKQINALSQGMGNIPMYAKGTGGSVLDWFGGKFESMMSFISKPFEMWKKIANNSYDASVFKGGSGKNIGDGSNKFAEKQSNWLENLINNMFGGFSGDASIEGNGVYSYLMNIARGFMSKYNMIFTSGYRQGDPYDHGKGLAVDIALPGVHGSPVYDKVANEAIAMPGVKYVITNGMWKHKGRPWVPWPDGDHYDHVHISGEMPTGNMSGIDGGGGVARWRPQVIASLKANGLPTTPTYVNAWMKQIQTESGGNPSVTGGNDGLADGNAMGLLQVKPGTFNANKHAGHNNVYNGYDNMLAAMRYAKNRYGFAGMLNVIGHGHGYANGGIVSQHQIAQIAEGNKPEAIIPLDPVKRSRAFSILSRVNKIVGFDNGSQITINNDYKTLENKVDNLTKTISNQQNVMISLLEIIAKTSGNNKNPLTKFLDDELSKALYGTGGIR